MEVADWDKGLPLDFLALVAKTGSIKDMQCMRAVSKTWQQGFELGVTSISISSPSHPVLPTSLQAVQRFPWLESLDIGNSTTNTQYLSSLGSFRHLKNLQLGHSAGPLQAWTLETRLMNSDLGRLRGMQLKALHLAKCELLTDAGVEALQGMPLSTLDLGGCFRLTDASLKFLKGMPLTNLVLRGSIARRSTLEYLRGLPLTCLDLGPKPRTEGIV